MMSLWINVNRAVCTTRTHIPARKGGGSRCDVQPFAIPYHISFKMCCAPHGRPFWLWTCVIRRKRVLPTSSRRGSFLSPGECEEGCVAGLPPPPLCVCINNISREEERVVAVPDGWWCQHSNCMLLLLCITCTGQLVDNARVSVCVRAYV